MDPLIYDEMLVQEKTHWWFLARKHIIGRLLHTLKLSPTAKILDAGCGSGGNLPILSQLGGELYAFETYDKARQNAQSLGIAAIEKGMLPGNIPFADVSFDLIALLDVLEHVEDDKAALAALVARLKSGGVLCINVPAYQWLFTRHDRLHHHFRRYGKAELLQMVKEAGLHIEFVSYWNCLLFPLAAIVRLVDCFGIPKERAIGADVPPRWINNLLYKIVSLESTVMQYARLPFGLSLIILARKIG